MTTVKLSGQTLLRHRDFMLLWGGQTVSQTGTQVTILALPLVAIADLNATTWHGRGGRAPGPRAVPGWLATTPYARVIVTSSLRVSNVKAEAELGWALQAPTYRTA